MKAERRLLDRYAEIAETFEAAGALDDAIATIELGAGMATVRHPGVYASVRMERLLARIGTTLPPFPPRPEAPTGRVLHVVTETYETGGHTRMVWRWIDRDPTNTHLLVSTSHEAGVPKGLAAAVRASGGTVLSMPGSFSNLTKAAGLREVAAGVDLVVVHSHAMDPLPTVAFADAEHRPPVVVFNHADHMFWLGASVADVLHCIRPTGVDFAAARGIAAERCVLTTAPVSGGDGNADADGEREEHRAAVLEHFGWPEDTVLLFSAGAGYKYQGPAGQSLLELVEPVLRAHPDVRLAVAGFASTPAWEAAAARTDGRVGVAGALTTLSRFFAAADIYLESRPYGGPGASSEAAAHGLPVLTHANSTIEASLFCTDSRYGATVVISPREYRRTLTRLIAEPELRAQWGDAARAAIRAADAAWTDGVATVTGAAAEARPTSVAELRPSERGGGPRDRLVEDLMHRMHGADVGWMTGVADLAAQLAASPGLRAAYGDITSIVTGPQRPYRAAVALSDGDPAAWPVVVAEFRRLQALGIAERFAIGLRPEHAEAAIPVLEAELDDDSITIDVFVNDAVEDLVGDRTLELVAPGAMGTGRGPIHSCGAGSSDGGPRKSPR